MFRHHKFCVIEIAGQLMGDQDPSGQLHMWLIDAADQAAPTSQQSQKVKIVDPDFCEYVRKNTTARKGAAHEYQMTARITGNVNMDGGETQLGDISQATLIDGKKVLQYDPRRLG